MSTALVVECATIISLEQRPLLPLKSSSVHLVFGALVLPLSLHTDPHLVDVLISADYFSTVLIVLRLLFDSLSIHLLLVVGAIVLQVFEFFLNFLIFLIRLTFLTIVIIIVIFFFVELLKDLNVLCRGVLVERLATIMDNVDFPVLINYVVVMEGTVGIEDEHLHTLFWSVVPLSGLINQPATVDEDQTSHEGVPIKLFQLCHQVHVGEHRDTVVLHLVGFKQRLN